MANGTPQPRSFAANLFAVPVLCAGLCLIAVCLLVPQAEGNRRMAVDRDRLAQDLAHADAQLAVDARFLDTAAADPEVAERLAQRQMRQIRTGTAALRLPGQASVGVATVVDMLRVPPPPPLPAFAPASGLVGELTATHRRQLLGLGGGLFLVAAGLILGPGRTDHPAAQPADEPR